jgi:hypothetical protein
LKDDVDPASMADSEQAQGRIHMDYYTHSDVRHYVLAVIGALIFSTTLIGVTVGPAVIGQPVGAVIAARA